MEIYETIKNMIFFLLFFGLLCLAINEIVIICYYDNKKLILNHEIQIYNFIYICSIINIINSLSLYWLLFNEYENKLFKYYVILCVFNILIGVWNITLFEHHIYLNNYIFNFVIIELYLFFIKCFTLIIYILTILLAPEYNNNNIIKENSLNQGFV